MKIKSIEISHYRAFYESEKVTLAIPDGRPGSGLTVIVGPNNSGKSTVLDSLLLFAKNQTVSKGDRHENKPIEIVFTDENGENKNISNKPSGGAQISITGESDLDLNSFEFIPSRRHWSAQFSGKKTLSDLRHNSMRVGRPDGLDSDLAKTLADIESDSDKLKFFNEIIRKTVPSFHEWKIEADDHGNYVEYQTKGGAFHRTNRFGDGLICLFRIAAHLIEPDKDKLLVIDEPELSLHPQGQKSLIALLVGHSKDRQILVATHSPHFIRWNDLENGTQIVRVAKKDDFKSEAKCIPGIATYKRKIISMEDDWMKPQLLDVVAKELFFADNIVFVEGQEDVALLRRFIQSEGIPINYEFFGYGCGGAENIKHLLHLTKDLGINSGALFDGDMTSLKDECNKDFPEAFIQVLPTDDIRDKYKQKIVNDRCKSTGEILKEGIFDSKGDIKSKFKVQLMDLIQKFTANFS